MRTRTWTIALALLCVATTANAKRRGRSVVEDPFAYDDREAKREQEREEEEARRTFGNSLDFVVSVERLVGYAYTSRTITVGGEDNTVAVNRMHLLANSGADPFAFSTPRLGFDLFVTSGLSFGAGFGYSNDSADDDTAMTVLVMAPRLGYAAMFGDIVGIWPRLGATMQQVAVEGAADGWMLAASADIPVLFVPTQHTLFTIGPSVDYGFAGRYLLDDRKNKLRVLDLGLQAGFSVFF